MALFATTAVMTALAPAAHGADNDADLAVKSDLRNVANDLETFYTDHQHYPGRQALAYDGVRRVDIGPKSVRLNRGDRLAALRLTSDRGAYCVHVVRAQGASDTTKPWSYVSDKGGLVSGGCPKRFSKHIA